MPLLRNLLIETKSRSHVPAMLRDASLFLKPEACELEHLAVLCHRPDDIFGGTIGHLGFDLEGDFHLSSHQPREVRKDFLCNPAGIATNSCGIQSNRPIEALWFCITGRRWRRGTLLALSLLSLFPRPAIRMTKYVSQWNGRQLILIKHFR